MANNNDPKNDINATELHQQAVVEADERRRQDQQARREGLRVNMMRSMVTEPLLSKIQQAAPGQRFDVIISINELFAGGIPGALEFLAQRAKQWNIPFANVTNYWSRR